MGELDLIAGRLEPGYAAPDLATDALFAEPMTIVVRPDDPLAKLERVGWDDLAGRSWVVPPPWASSCIKLNQMFYMQSLMPPADIIESALLLVTLTFMWQRPSVAFVALGVGRYLEWEGLAKVVGLEVPIELPAVGIITMRGRIRTPASEQLIECLQQVAREARADCQA